MSKALKWGRKCTIAIAIAPAPYIIIRKFTYYTLQVLGRQKQEGLKHSTPPILQTIEVATYNLGKCNCNFLSAQVNGNVLITLLLFKHANWLPLLCGGSAGRDSVWSNRRRQQVAFYFCTYLEKKNSYLYIILSRIFIF